MGKSRKPKEVTEAPFSVTLKVGADSYTSTGQTLLEAFENLEQPKVMVKSTLIFEGNGKHFERTLMPMKMRQLLRPAFRKLHVKQIEPFLK